MPNVYELTHGFNNIVAGTPLVFPNVLTCMAFVACNGLTLVGVHFTQLDQSTARINGAWARVQAIAPGAHNVYVAGPGWNANLLANLHPAPASFRGAVTAGHVDVRATLLPGGGVRMETAPAGSGGPWMALTM